MAPGQLATVYFGYNTKPAKGGVHASADDGLTVTDNFVDNEQDAMYSEEEFVDSDVNTTDTPTRVYLPTIAR